MPDWTELATWAGGIATVVGSVIASIWLAISKAKKVADAMPAPVSKTDIITADTVAMERLAATIEASNVILTENNVLRKEEHSDRREMREALEENTRAVGQARDQIIEARRDIKDLTIQMARAGK